MERIASGRVTCGFISSDLVDVGAQGGSIVSVKDERGNFVGQALFSDTSQIALRFLTQSNEEIDREWWRRRIAEAASRRHILSDTNAYRLIYSEGDLLPSLIVDRYDDVLVLQTLSQGTDAVKPLLTEILIEEFSPRAVIERNDARVRELEGLPLIAGALYGDLQPSWKYCNTASLLRRAVRWTEDRIVSGPT